MSQEKEQIQREHLIPFFIINLENHFERTVDLWNLKTPSLAARFYRTTIFITSLLFTVLWPIHDPIINLSLILLSWILLSLTNKKIPRFLLMLNLMINLMFLYYLIQTLNNTLLIPSHL